MNDIEDEIAAAEARIGLVLPQAYRNFLKGAGNFTNAGEGPRPPSELKTLAQEAEMFVCFTDDYAIDYEGELRHRLVLIDQDGAGNIGALLYPSDGGEPRFVVDIGEELPDEDCSDEALARLPTTMTLEAWLEWASAWRASADDPSGADGAPPKRAGLPDAGTPRIPSVLPAFVAYYESHAAWGSLHSLEDLNTGDDSMAYCIERARELKDIDGEVLGGILALMSEDQRLKLAFTVEGAPFEKMTRRRADEVSRIIAAWFEKLRKSV